jgi:hypothetical protein
LESNKLQTEWWMESIENMGEREGARVGGA